MGSLYFMGGSWKSLACVLSGEVAGMNCQGRDFVYAFDMGEPVRPITFEMTLAEN